MSANRTRWKDITLGDLGNWGSGGTPKSTEPSYYDGQIPWIRSGDLPDGPILEHAATITDAGLENSSAKWVPSDAILIALYGATIGKLGTTTYPVTTNQAVAYCIPNKCTTSSRYLFWYLLHLRPELIALGQGGAQPNISQTILKKHHFRLPPIDAQDLLVKRLEKLFERSKNARSELMRIPRLVERYKEAILAAAFRGDLTADWRLSCGGSINATQDLEAADELRFSSWASEQLKYKGKATTQPNVQALKARYKKPYADAEMRFDIPGTWTFGTVDRLSHFVTDGEHATPPRTDAGVLLLSARNVLNGSLSLAKVDFISDKTYSALSKRVLVQKGDVLLSCSGTVGRSCVFPDNLQASFVRSVAIIRPVNIHSEYLALSLRSPDIQTQIRDRTTSTGQPNIFQGKIKTLSIPVAPIDEQLEVVRRINRAFRSIDTALRETTRATDLIDRLDQATLAKAFRGELLMPQRAMGS